MNQEKPLLVSHFDSQSRSQILPYAPLLSSQNLDWKDINFDYYQYADYKSPKHCLEHHVISIPCNSIKTERQLDGVYQSEYQTFGSTAVIPAEVEHWVAWTNNVRFIILSVVPNALAEIAPETINPDKVELLPTFAQPEPDHLIAGISMAIKQQLETEANDGGFYIEHLKNALFAHLIKHYCTHQFNFKQDQGGLPPYKLKQAIEYINDNLDQKIKLDDVAQLLDISQFYFSHMFKESTGIAPYKYVIKQRLERAKQLIKQSKLPLAEIALESGFTSQSQMTQHFRKCVGVTPKAYRNQL